jgi:hypothetical protein
MRDRLHVKTPADESGLVGRSFYPGTVTRRIRTRTVPVIAKSYALSNVQPPDITRTCALASVELIAHHSRQSEFARE